MTHWVNQYIGLPYSSFNCWELVRHIMREHYGRDIPAVVLPIQDVKGVADQWQLVTEPRDGDGVLMRNGKAPHVGVFVDVDGGKVLHSMRKTGVVISTFSQLDAVGLGFRKFYRYK